MGCNIHQLSQVVNNLLAAKHCQGPAAHLPGSKFRVQKGAADNCLSDNRRPWGGCIQISARSEKEEGFHGRRTVGEWLRPSVPARMGQSLLQVLGEKLGGAVPGELGALSIIISTRFIAEGVAGIIPIGFT